MNPYALLTALLLKHVNSFQIVSTTSTGITVSKSINGEPRTHVLNGHSYANIFPCTTTTSSRLLATAETSVLDNSAPTSNGGKIIGNSILLLPHNAKEVKSKFGGSSPYGCPSILEAAEQLQRKADWFSAGTVNVDIVFMPEDASDNSKIQQQLLNTDALIAFNLGERGADLDFLKDVFNSRKKTLASDKSLCQFALDCGNGEKIPKSLCGPYDPESPSLASSLFPWSSDASGKRMEEQMMGLFDRWTSDDFTYSLMVFFNQYFAPIDWVKYSIDATWEKGGIQNAKELYSMVTKCGDCVANCVKDEKCKECLDALTAVDTSDQVASYRTIVSYESELLRDFSFCILQKNNIFNCDAQVPESPKVKPLTTFRGEPLTKDIARAILVGHLDDSKALEGSEKSSISWKVAAGANVAYDQFPSQNQIFYESANGKSMWYDPVFRVETIDGRNVWAKRHYRVADGVEPGTFKFSVLDNGVTSNEFWTIVDVADDLSYIIFHYAGAAGAVGQSYLGGLLCTSDGSLPSESERENKIYPKLRSAGIDPWELFIVDNSEDSPGAIDAGIPPLDFYRKDVIKRRNEMNK